MSSITNGRGGSHSRPAWKIPNGKYANPTYQFRDWVLFFPKEDGVDNMALAGKDFFRFWDNPSIKEIRVRGNLFLTGKLYGCHGHINGHIPTKRPSRVVLLKRLSQRGPLPKSRDRINRLDRDEMCLYTEDGELYFFIKSDLHISTAEFLSYFKYGGTMKHQIPSEYCEDDVI